MASGTFQRTVKSIVKPADKNNKFLPNQNNFFWVRRSHSQITYILFQATKLEMFTLHVGSMVSGELMSSVL